MSLHRITDCPYVVPRYNFWGALIGAGVALGTSIYNAYSSHKTNKKNEEYAEQSNEFTREQFDYNKQLNAELMSREDNAYQRAVVDARRAGLSPLVVSGTGGAGAGGTVSQSNLSMQSPDLRPPQLEANTFMDAMRSLEDQGMQQRSLDAQSKSQDKQLTFESQKLSATLDAQNEMLDKQLEASSQSQDRELADRQAARIEQRKQFNKQLNFLIDSKNSDYIMEMQKEAAKSASAMGVKNFFYVDSEQAYKAGMDAFTSAYTSSFERAMSNFEADHGLGVDSVSQTETGNVSGSTKAGLSAGFGGSSSGAGVGANMGADSSESSGRIVNKTSNAFEQAERKSMISGNRVGFPILIKSVKARD